MLNHKFYFITFIFIASSCTCRSEVIRIHGISRICQTPYGRFGKCVSRENCYQFADCDRRASVWSCQNGHGDPPYVCCVFGKGIVFPDDDYIVGSKAPGPVVSRSDLPLESPSSGIIMPNDKSRLEIPLPPPARLTIQAANTLEEPKSALALFPKDPVCGPMTVIDKIHGGREANLGEFPWLVNLEYRNEYGDLDVGCAGNILNSRFVLTAAHCVTGPVEEKLLKLESLRVGDHNIANDKDCDEEKCLDPYERFFISESIVHDNFMYTKRGKMFNDIALLKTDHDMRYSLGVAPICLPEILPSLKPPAVGSRLTVAGWGYNGTDFTDEKRIVDVPYVEIGNCSFGEGDARMCAGGVRGKDSCTGDSGGSLARRTPLGWVIEGLVSYGSGCGTEKAAIYTRIRPFLPWIHEHVEKSIRSNMRSVRFSSAYLNQPIKLHFIALLAIFSWLLTSK